MSDTFSPGNSFKTYRFAMGALDGHRKHLAARIQESVRKFYGERHQLPGP